MLALRNSLAAELARYWLTYCFLTSTQKEKKSAASNLLSYSVKKPINLVAIIQIVLNEQSLIMGKEEALNTLHLSAEH